MSGRFDDMLYNICQEAGGIEGLLDTIFDFMYRRTDFFYEADPGDKMGFPPGQQPQMLLRAYSKFQEQHYKTRVPRKDPEQFQKKLEAFKQQYEQKKQAQQQQDIQQQKEKIQKAQKEKQEEQMIIEKEKQSPQPVKQEQKQKQPQKPVQQQQQQKQETQAPETVKLVSDSQFSTYNGGQTDRYKWSQTIDEVSVEINLPCKTRTKEMKVDLQHKKLKVILKGELFIEGEFFLGIKADESYWTIEDETKLILTLDKAQENIWKTVLIGDTEIDTKKVDNTKPLNSFDGETQGAIRKVMYDQQRKQMGLPTSDEENQMEMMKKAWDAEGSPFKGQPFDPSKLNFSQEQPQF